MSSSTCREIKLVFQLTKSIVIDTSYSMGDIKKIIIDIFNPLITDDLSMTIRDFEVTNLEKINVFHSLDYYKSNVIAVNSHPSILNTKKLVNLNEKQLSIDQNSEIERLKEALTQLKALKESYTTNTKIDSSEINVKPYMSKEKQQGHGQIDLRKSNGMASTKEFSAYDERSRYRGIENKLNHGADHSRNQNYFSPSQQNYNFSYESKDLQKQAFSNYGHNQRNQLGIIFSNDSEKEFFNKPESFGSLLEKINTEIQVIMKLNTENNEKKEKLKRNLVKSQDIIKNMKEQLENSLCKEKVYEKMLKENQRKLISIPTENDNNEAEYKNKINELENYVVSLNEFNSTLQKNVKDYEDYTIELKKTIDILKSKGNILETETNQCMCDVKNQEILTLKKVIDELYKKCDEYEKQKLKDSVKKLSKENPDKQDRNMNLENVLKVGIEEKDKLIQSLKTTEANMNVILARYKENLFSLCTYLKESKSSNQNKAESYLSNKGNQNDIFYEILKKKEETINELNMKITNQSQVMKELVTLNNQLSLDLKKICAEEEDSKDSDDYKYQINLLKKINDVLINKNTELTIQYGNQITCQASNNNTEFTPLEKVKELEIRLVNLSDDYEILKKQNEIYKQLFDEKNIMIFSALGGFEILGKVKKIEDIINQEIFFNLISDLVPREVLIEDFRKVKEEEVSKCVNLQKQLGKIENELKEAVKRASILTENLENRDKEISRKSTENEEVKSKLLTCQNERNSLSDEVNRLKEDIIRINGIRVKEISNKGIESEEVKSKLLSCQIERNSLSDEVNKLKEDIIRIKEIRDKEISNKGIENDEIKSKLLSCQIERNSLSDEVNKLKEDILRINGIRDKEVIDLNSEIDKLKNNLNDSFNKVLLLEEKIAKQDLKIKECIESLKKNGEEALLKESCLNTINDEKRKIEEKLFELDQKYNQLLKQSNEDKQKLQKEFNEYKTLKENEIKEVKRKLENDVLRLNQKNCDDKSLLESQLKQQSEFLQRYKFEAENLKASVDKLNQEKEKLMNESFSKSRDGKTPDHIEKEMKNYEIQTNSLINDNKDLAKRLEEMKTKYSSVKEDYERMLKNSMKNDLLNKYNVLDKKYITLKREYRSLVGNHSKLDKSSLIHNLSQTGNNFLTSSEEEEEDISDDDQLMKKLVTIKEGTTFIFGVFDNKRILRFDLENRKFFLQDFADFAEFENNFDPQGSIYLNVKDGLLIVTGENHDLFYQYSYSKNCINKLNKLNDNHAHGGLIYYEKENSLICLSGWHNRRVEKYLNMEITFTFMDEMDITDKKINEKNKNVWVHMPDMISERSECPYIIVNNLYLYAFFGFNCPKMKYLESIERLNLDKQEAWENVKFNNELHLSTFIKSHSCIKYTEDEILFVGGYDGKNEVPVENFSFYNLKANKISPNHRKFPDIIKNHCYYFQKHFNFIPFIESDNKKHFASIDEQDNIHVIEVGSLQYDIYKFED